jgi:hypothetical protein
MASVWRRARHGAAGLKIAFASPRLDLDGDGGARLRAPECPRVPQRATERPRGPQRATERPRSAKECPRARPKSAPPRARPKNARGVRLRWSIAPRSTSSVWRRSKKGGTAHRAQAPGRGRLVSAGRGNGPRLSTVALKSNRRAAPAVAASPRVAARGEAWGRLTFPPHVPPLTFPLSRSPLTFPWPALPARRWARIPRPTFARAAGRASSIPVRWWACRR